MTKGQRVQKALIDTDVDVPYISEAIGVNESTVYRWKKKGKGRFDKETLENIARVLRVDYNWLQYGEQKGENQNTISEKDNKGGESTDRIFELLKEERSRYGISDIPDTEMGRHLQSALDDAVSLVIKLRRLVELDRDD